MQKSRIGTTIALVVLAIAIVGCAVWFGYMLGRQSVLGDLADAFGVSSSASSQAKQEKTFDGSALSDVGPGTMYLSTSGGTSENGNIPKISHKKGSAGTGCAINYEGGDGSICEIYVDGVKYDDINASERIKQSIVFEGSALDDGLHVVEVVKMANGEPEIYKKAQYEIVSHS